MNFERNAVNVRRKSSTHLNQNVSSEVREKSAFCLVGIKSLCLLPLQCKWGTSSPWLSHCIDL